MHHGRRRMGRKSLMMYTEKKAQKLAAKVAKKLKAQDISGHANDSNSFGDPNLSERFVWRKKIEHDLSRGLPLDTFSLKAEKKRQRERMIEIEKVKKGREYRALEKARQEEETALLARERAQVESQGWEKKEREFLFYQSKVGSEIRQREGRSKPIDLLTKHLYPSDDLDIEIDEPYMVFKGLTVQEMEELYEDIKMHLDLDRATPTHVQYWQALLIVCDWELSEARKEDSSDPAIVRGEQLPPDLLVEEQGMHSSIEPDVQRLLQGKSSREPEALRSQVEAQMQSGAAKVVEFWEVLLSRLDIFMAKARLEEIHAEILSRHLQHLEKPTEVGDSEIEFSPKPDNREPSHDGKDAQVLFPKCTMREGNTERSRQELGAGPARPEDSFERNALKAKGALEEEGDTIFALKNEINLDSQVYWWHDKYSPRKPKYIIRVHTGYEWNKYNQTHYDHDSPPPKIVQGYKFNIFYPDLVDKEKAPTYAIEKDGNSSETCIIRFHSGPPYEDVAFRVVNKDWDYSRKKGFKCTFGQGVLRLYFNFKRYRYRR